MNTISILLDAISTTQNIPVNEIITLVVSAIIGAIFREVEKRRMKKKHRKEVEEALMQEPPKKDA